jgi:hypothetical protein
MSYFDDNIVEVRQMKEEGYPLGVLADDLAEVTESLIDELGR